MVRVLVIEDRPSEAQRMIFALEQLGHTVSHITGARSVKDDAIVSRSNDRISPQDFDVALVDATLEGEYHGWDLVIPLVKAGVLCIAISAGGQYNPMVVKAGAQLALPKEHVVPDLESGKLDLSAALQTHRNQNCDMNQPRVD